MSLPAVASARVWRREARDFAAVGLVAVPPAALSGWLLWRADSGAPAWAALGVGVGLSAVLAARVHARLARKLRTVGSVLSAYREGDFSVRARDRGTTRVLSELLAGLNALGDTLRDRRLGEMEAWALLRKVMAEIDVVVVAVDDDRRVKLTNHAAARAFGEPEQALLGRDITSLGLGGLLDGDAPRVVSDPAPQARGRWELRRGVFRLSGEPHTLLVLSDMSSALREQERDAWKRLIRVMGHEINNSLAPIQSLSESLRQALADPGRPDGWEEDAASGLSVISRRAEALGRFMTAYSKLARLPPPTLAPVSVKTWVERAAALEQRAKVSVLAGPDVTLAGDADQLDQLLINLIKNGVDAALATGGAVRVSWETAARGVRVTVEDDGPGLGDSANLFVPFFTTKPGGTGVGLVVARQIAEAHGGSVSLQPRASGQGAQAVVRLPLGG